MGREGRGRETVEWMGDGLGMGYLLSLRYFILVRGRRTKYEEKEGRERGREGGGKNPDSRGKGA